MPDLLPRPWPWYVGGPLIGLMVPGLLLLGNKLFGFSSNLRHICAACFPGTVAFFRYDWKKTGTWNLAFLAGTLLGGFIGGRLLAPGRAPISPPTPTGLTPPGRRRPPALPAPAGVSCGARGAPPG